LPLVAVQLVPTFNWAPWSAAALRSDWNSGAGSPPGALWSLLMPNYWGVFTPDDPAKFTGAYNYTFLYCYSGFGAVVLAALGLYRAGAWGRWFTGLAALFFLLQCGTFLPGFDLVMAAFPAGLRGAVYMNFFLGAACLALVLAAASAASRLPSRWAWAAALATAVELVAISGDRPMNAREGSWRRVTSERTVDGSRQTVTALEALLREQQPPWRLDLLDLNYSFTMNASWRRMATPNGDNPLAPLRVVDLRRAFATGNWWERQLPVGDPSSGLLDFLNVRYLLASSAREDRAALAAAGWDYVTTTETGLRIYRNREVLPRFRLVGAVRGAGSRSEALRATAIADLRSEVIVEGNPPPATASGEVRVVSYQANRVELEASARGPSVLTTSETFHPGWRTQIDGQPTETLLVNGAFRGAALAAGKHRVVMIYHAPDVWFWGAVSMGFWGIGVLSLQRKGHPSSVGRAADS
jgi:hypothetical protein